MHMEPQPVKCLNCDTWNLPEAKFCKTCGEELEPYRQLAHYEQELGVRKKFIAHIESLQEEERKQQVSNGGCASVIVLMITLSGIGPLILL